MQVATVVLGLAAWWSAACRVGQMSPGMHRRLVRWWHGTVGALALVCVGWVVLRGGDLLALCTVASLLAYLMATLHEWQGGPPRWSLMNRGR
jgi:hypothetical protein